MTKEVWLKAKACIDAADYFRELQADLKGVNVENWSGATVTIEQPGNKAEVFLQMAELRAVVQHLLEYAQSKERACTEQLTLL